MKKSTKIAIPLIAGVGAAALFTEEMYRHIFCRNGSKILSLLTDSKGHETPYYQYKEEAIEKFKAVPCEKYTINSQRGEKLSGFYYPNGANGKKIVFIIHGYRSEHIDTACTFYDYYKSRGIDMFCCDHTAHGESGGNFIGLDYFESQDCLSWVHWLINKFGPDTEIILHGFSMGGATVLQMSSHCPDNVKFIVSDSGYMNPETSIKRQSGIMYQPMRLINKAVAGYDLKDIDVTKSLEKSTKPILFVHGYEDRLVPFEAGQYLYSNYEGEKDCLFCENTRHVESIYTHPEEYAEKLDSFIEKYM